MKCTNKRKKQIVFLILCCVFMSGCAKTSEIADSYQISDRNPYAGQQEEDSSLQLFTSDLCVTDNQNIGTDRTTSQVAEAAGLFNTSTLQVSYAQNIYAKMYPASTTKILTAYLVLKNCDLNDTVTVSAEAVDQASDSSVCGLNEGDVITVKDLLYGLMLASGNDAAYALAEHCSGSQEAFADLMNQTANSFGACNSHFMNPNGLPNEDHYTSVYDMYLISKNAITQSTFREIIHTSRYEAKYQDKNGTEVSRIWTNTNHYITEEEPTPEGVSVIGGKTGTTNAAGYCLVIFAQNEKGEDLISIVFKADGRSNLYLLMSQILKNFSL